MITICRKAFFYEQLKLGKISFFEVPLSKTYFNLIDTLQIFKRHVQNAFITGYYRLDLIILGI